MSEFNNKNWKCISVIFDGEDFLLDGINIWNHKWELTNEKVKVKDPKYNKQCVAEVYNILFDEINIQFAVAEFSNNVWGIYQSESF
jgi:ribonuclease HI